MFLAAALSAHLQLAEASDRVIVSDLSSKERPAAESLTETTHGVTEVREDAERR